MQCGGAELHSNRSRDPREGSLLQNACWDPRALGLLARDRKDWMMRRTEDSGCGNKYELWNRSGTLAARGSWAGRHIHRGQRHEFQPQHSCNFRYCSWGAYLQRLACGIGSIPIPTDRSAHMFHHCCQCYGSGGPYRKGEVGMAKESCIYQLGVGTVEENCGLRGRKLLKNDETNQ